MTQPDMTPYTPKEIEEMRRLINAERYAEYHAYNYTHRHRDWSLHAANIVAGNGPDAANVRAFLRWYFGDEMTESLRIRISSKVAEADFKWIANNDGGIPTDFDSVKKEVVDTMVGEFDFLAESFPGTMTYGSMVGADTIYNIENYFKVAISTIVGLWAFATTSDTPPEGAIVLENGVILNPNDEFGGFVGIHQEKEEMIRRGFFPILLAILRHAFTDPDNKNRAPQGIGVPMWDILPLPEEDVDPGTTLPSQPPVAVPGNGDSRVTSSAPQSMSAPVEDDEASEFDLPIPAPSPTVGELQEIAAPMPDPLHALLPGLDRGPAIEVAAGFTTAPAAGTDVPAQPSGEPTPIGSMRPLTPHSFPGGGGGDTKLKEASLSSVLPALDQGSTIDLGRADTHQIADSADADSPLIAASFDTPTVPDGALANAAATRPGRPTSVTVGGRVYTREEVMAQTTISADGRRSTWTIPQPEPASEPPLTEKRVRQLIREGINEWDSGFGVRYRSRHYIRHRRG